MEINELKTVVSVAKHASFSMAAKQLYVTQPAVSKRVTALEEELNTKLFDRLGKKVLLTQAGEVLLAKAHVILKEIDEGRRMIANLSGQVCGRLSLGTSHHIGLHRLPTILRAYTNQYPEVELDLHFLDSETGCEAIEHGELDLVIVTLPPKPAPTVTVRRLWDDPLDIVVAPNHPLAQCDRITMEDLAAQPAILPTRGTFTRDMIVRPFAERQLNLNVILETNYLETNKMMVTIGLGWSALPRTMVDQDLCCLTIRLLNLSRTLGVMCNQSRTLSNAARALLAMIQSTDIMV